MADLHVVCLLVCVLVTNINSQSWSTGNDQFGQNRDRFGGGDRYGSDRYNNDRYSGSQNAFGSTFGSNLGGGNSLEPFRVIFEWFKLDYSWIDEMTKAQSLQNRRFIPENNAIAGIKVWRDRVFLSIPRWKEGVPVTLASIPSQPLQNNAAPRLDPFPNWQMQEIGNCSALQFVQSFEIDTEGRIWILDSGRTNILSGTGHDSRCSPKLVIIDLNSVQFPFSNQFGGGAYGNPGYQGQGQYPNQQYPNQQYPNQPYNPNNPNQPYNPNNPNQPYNPNNPNQPYNPNNPNQPYNPNNPNQPYNPNNPNQPYNPNNPNQPYNPNNPNQPYNPNNPNNPNQPYNPNNPNQPYNPNNPNQYNRNTNQYGTGSNYPNNPGQYGSNYPGQATNYPPGFNNYPGYNASNPQYDQFGNFIGGNQNRFPGQQYPNQGGFPNSYNPTYPYPNAFGNQNFRIVKSFNFPSNVATQFGSYLNDIVLDNSNGWYAYITDHGDDPGIIVYSFREERAWKVKDARSMRSDPDTNFISINNIDVELRGKNLDGIALSPASGYERTLYYSPLGSYNLYSVPTSVLKNPNLPSDISASVRDLGRKTSITDGMIMDNRGSLYFGLLGMNAVAVWDSNRGGRIDDGTRILARDSQALQWPDTFSIDDAGNLWVVTNRLQNYLTGRINLDEPNYRVLRAPLGVRSYLAPADNSPRSSSFDGRSNSLDGNYWGGGYNSYWNAGQAITLNIYALVCFCAFLIVR